MYTENACFSPGNISISLVLLYTGHTYFWLILHWQYLRLTGFTVHWLYLLLVGSTLAISPSHWFYCTGHTCFWLVLHWQHLLLIGSILAIPASHCSLRVKFISNWLCWLYLLIASSIQDIQYLLLVGFGWFHLLQIGYFHKVSILYTDYTFF
jgi:hypothetical protein